MGETERPLFKIGDSLAITIPKEWIKKHGLKKGDKLRMYIGDKILCKPIKHEK